MDSFDYVCLIKLLGYEYERGHVPVTGFVGRLHKGQGLRIREFDGSEWELPLIVLDGLTFPILMTRTLTEGQEVEESVK